MWIIYAILAAVFAAATSILARIGIENVNANLATAIRTIVVLIMAWSIVFITGVHREIPNITTRSLVFLILSGISTGASWLFFFRALQTGEVIRVVPIDKLSVVITMVMAVIFLGETLDLKAIIGGILITVGTIILIL
ncbi:MAG: EamA family transporter [Defluviitaleaceae bacterium]|nr:EamA family transporter [Defluviitaleaceae bacterium]